MTRADTLSLINDHAEATGGRRIPRNTKFTDAELTTILEQIEQYAEDSDAEMVIEVLRLASQGEIYGQ